MPKAKPPNGILQACCADEDGIYRLTQTFIRGKWECATDGRIIVRRPTRRVNSKCQTPDVAILSWAAAAYEPEPIPMLGVGDLTGDPAAPIAIAPGVLLQSRYVEFLRKHKAKVYLSKVATHCPPLRFTIKPNYEGLVMQMATGGRVGECDERDTTA